MTLSEAREIASDASVTNWRLLHLATRVLVANDDDADVDLASDNAYRVLALQRAELARATMQAR